MIAAATTSTPATANIHCGLQRYHRKKQISGSRNSRIASPCVMTPSTTPAASWHEAEVSAQARVRPGQRVPSSVGSQGSMAVSPFEHVQLASALNVRQNLNAFKAGVMAETVRGEQTRALILDTALRLFRERGYGRTTMRAIADEAGVAVGNAYYYFGSKEHLVQEFYTRLQDE